MNAAGALFTSEYQAHSGTDIEVVGRNFDQSEFGGPTPTQLRLHDGNGAIYAMPAKDLTRYHVTFTVGSEPLTDGRGLGQLRRVVSISGNTITVETPFAVTPDDTSKWTLVTRTSISQPIRTSDNIVGILPYGIAYDTVIADNVLTNTDGITVWAINQPGVVDIPSYFTRIKGNTVTGVSRAALSNHIGLIGARQAPNYFDVMVYGSEIVGGQLKTRTNNHRWRVSRNIPSILWRRPVQRYPNRRYHEYNSRPTNCQICKSASC